MKTILSVAVCVSVAGIFVRAGAQSPKNDQAIADRIRDATRAPAVVKIVTDCGDEHKPSGSGFIVGGRYVFTARHVVFACSQNAQDRKRVYTETEFATAKKSAQDSTQSIQIMTASGRTWESTPSSPFPEVAISPAADFAVIDLGAQRNPLPSLCIAPRQVFEPNKLATLYGYGDGNPPAPRLGHVDIAETDDHYAQINLTAGPGWSGGPVTDERGYVVGVESGGNPAANFALPLFRVQSIVQNLNILPAVQAQEAELDEHEDQASCPDPNGKLLGYEHTEILPRQHFGPVDGGFDQGKACGSIIGNLVAKYPSGAVLTPGRSDEHGWWEGLQHRKYEYWCDVKVEWGPIYQSTRHAACGPVIWRSIRSIVKLKSVSAATGGNFVHRRTPMRRRTIILVLIATSCVPARPTIGWTLITEDEAARAHAGAPMAQAPSATPPIQPGAPRIEVLQPDETKPVIPPVTIRLRFLPQQNSTIDVSSFRAMYDSWFSVDITNRILQHAQISESGLIAENAEIPHGHYKITLEIADNLHRLGIRTFDFAVL